MANWTCIVPPAGPIGSKGHFIRSGQTVSDTQITLSLYTALGAVFWPASDPIVAAAALGLAARRGVPPDVAANVMIAACQASTNGQTQGNGVSNIFGTVTKYSATIGFAALSAAALTITLSPSTLVLPSSTRVLAHEINVTQAFAGSGVTGLTVGFGGASSTEIVSTQSLLAAGLFGGTSGVNPQPLYSAGSQLQALFTATGANLSALTSGSVTIDVLAAVLP